VLETINGLVRQLAGEISIEPQNIRRPLLPAHDHDSPAARFASALHPGGALRPDGELRSRTARPGRRPKYRSAGHRGLCPGVGSYVGGDITSGLLCTDLSTNAHDVFLFMDIGTNGEIVIGNADWMVACACSAGPAFEGAGIKCGMRGGRRRHRAGGYWRQRARLEFSVIVAASRQASAIRVSSRWWANCFGRKLWTAPAASSSHPARAGSCNKTVAARSGWPLPSNPDRQGPGNHRG